jgi:hypothetical protein
MVAFAVICVCFTLELSRLFLISSVAYLFSVAHAVASPFVRMSFLRILPIRKAYALLDAVQSVIKLDVFLAFASRSTCYFRVISIS